MDKQDYTDYEDWGKFCPNCDVRMDSMVISRDDHILTVEYTCPVCGDLIEE